MIAVLAMQGVASKLRLLSFHACSFQQGVWNHNVCYVALSSVYRVNERGARPVCDTIMPQAEPASAAEHALRNTRKNVQIQANWVTAKTSVLPLHTNSPLQHVFHLARHVHVHEL
jgi:hypothetical protein